MTRPKLGDYTYLDALPETAWSYLAGLLVGEGHLGVSGDATAPQFKLSIKIGDKRVCQHLATTFGGKVSAAERAGTTYVRESGNRRTFTHMYRWDVQDGYLIKILVLKALPYIQGGKQQQATKYLDFVTLKLTLWERKADEGRRTYTDAEQQALLTLAFDARKTALGGRKAWKRRWSKHLETLNARASAGTQAESHSDNPDGTDGGSAQILGN